MLERLRAEQKRLNMRDFTGAELRIRTASRDDLSSLVEILNYYITHSNVTFQTNETTVEDRLGWFEDFGKGPYQILVAEREGTVIGCAYSSRYRAGPAFDTTVETSIYLDTAHHGVGAGTALYSVLFQRLGENPVHLAVAGVALPNDASIALHRKIGFVEVGTFREYARKNGNWMSSTWFQRNIKDRLDD
jgi:phosphinothricin acetyltransferase